MTSTGSASEQPGSHSMAGNAACRQPPDAPSPPAATPERPVQRRGSALSQQQRISDKADTRALSIRQAYAELILRGTCGQHTCGEQIKPIEFRSRPTLIIGSGEVRVLKISAESEPWGALI